MKEIMELPLTPPETKLLEVHKQYEIPMGDLATLRVQTIRRFNMAFDLIDEEIEWADLCLTGSIEIEIYPTTPKIPIVLMSMEQEESYKKETQEIYSWIMTHLDDEFINDIDSDSDPEDSCYPEDPDDSEI
jgi:hypothetical protein